MAAKKLSDYFGISIRNERFKIEDLRGVSFRVNTVSCEIKDISESGMSIQRNEALDNKKEFDIDIIFREKCLYQLKAEIVRHFESSGQHNYAFKFTDGLLPENFLNNLKLCSEIYEEICLNEKQQKMLREDFILSCSLLRDSLIKLKEKCIAYEKINYIQSLDTKTNSIDVAIKVFGEHMMGVIKKYAHELDQSIQNINNKEIKKAHADYFKTHLGEYFISAAFTGRAFHKPRGYAGDYEMMNQIYRNTAEGESLFEKIIHLYGVNESSSISVRLRKDYLKNKVNLLGKRLSHQDEIIVGSLACGPAREVIEYLSEEDPEILKKFRFILMDQDHHALLNARRNIIEIVNKRNLKCEVNFLPLSVKQILEGSEEAEVLSVLKFDLLYTAGLYDYLPQQVAKNLTTVISRRISPEGCLIIGNFHPNNPTKTISDLVADWRLIHRDENQLSDLVKDSDFKRTEFYLDEIGIDLFIEAYK